MPKSLEMKSDGLDFDRFMKAIVRVPMKKKPKKAIKKEAAPKGR
jgi:hypothetical protein